MPHVPEEGRARLRAGGMIAGGDVGELCFLFADWGLQKYNALPKWRTIHFIKKALMNPYHNEETHEICRKHGTAFDKLDIVVAAELAFTEFYRLVAGPHEDCKVIENGNAFEGAKIPVPTLSRIEKVVSPKVGRKKAVGGQAVV